MTTSEPTTGEIVRALRDCLNVGCEECILHETEITPECKSHYCGAPTKLADRLESLQRENVEKDAQIEAQGKEMVRRDTIIKELTARADEAIAAWNRRVDE